MKKFRAGFTLIELSIVLAILGILTAGGLTVGGVLVDQQRFTDSNTRVDEARLALVDYFKLNGRLPCVAPQNIAMGATGYGVELASCATGVAATGATIRVRADGSACTASTTDANCVRIGALPVRTLGLRDAAAADDYGNKLIYAVSEDMTDVTKVTASSGRITILDGIGTIVANGAAANGAAFSVVSPGPDGKGAYKLLNGVQTTACGASGNLDVENCNGDAVFRDTQFNNGNQAASFYDDIPTWLPKYQLTTASTAATNSLWTESGTNIYATGSDNDVNTGNVGIGTANPQYRFDVQQTRNETSGGRYYTARNLLNVAPTGASSAYQSALWNVCSVSTGNNITNDVLCVHNGIYNNNTGTLALAYAGYDIVENTAAGTIGIAYGEHGTVHNVANGTITQGIATYGVIQNLAAGSVGTAYGTYGIANNISSGSMATAYGAAGVTQNYAGTITTAYGVNGRVHNYAAGNIGTAIAGRFEVSRTAGTITNGYGVFIDDVQATTQYGIYQNGADDMNYFGGNIGIGANPASNSKLQVQATGNSSYGIQSTGSGTGSYAIVGTMPAGSQGVAVQGNVAGATSWGVHGNATGVTSIGVYGQTSGTSSYGVYGFAGGTGSIGVYGSSANASSQGVFAYSTGATSISMYALATNATSHALLALNTTSGYHCYIGYVNTHALVCNGPNNIVSDRREKKEIAPLAHSEGLDSVMRLRPVHYMWKDDRKNATGKKQIGFIAQEVEDVFPDLIGTVKSPSSEVDKNGKRGPDGPSRKTLNYEGIIPPTVLAVQQLKHEKDALEARVKALETKLGLGDAGVAGAAADGGVFGIGYKQLAILLFALLLGVFGTLVVRRK